MQLSASGMKCLKALHLLAVACWIGGAASLVYLHTLRFEGVSGYAELYGIDRAASAIDSAIVVVAGAFGSLITGLTYSVATKWGFFRFWWVTAKWIITVGCITFGMLALGPWEEGMLEVSFLIGKDALQESQYLALCKKNYFFGIVQCCILITAVVISVFKPWGKRIND